MIADAASRDHDLIFQRRAFRSRCQLAVLYGVACRLKEAKRRLQSCCILLILCHIVCVDRIAVYVCGECDLVALVGNTRCCPGGIGDRVVDYVCPLAVVGIHSHVAVYGQNGCNTLTQVSGSLGARLAANAYVLRVDADVAVSKVCHGLDGDHVAVKVLVAAVQCGHLIDRVKAEGRTCNIQCARAYAACFICFLYELEVDVFDLRLALVVQRICLYGCNAVLIAFESVRTSAQRLCRVRLHAGEVALRETEVVVVNVKCFFIAIVMKRSDEGD